MSDDIHSTCFEFFCGCRKLEQIVAYNGARPREGEDMIAILTASDRSVWADARTKHFSSGVNKESLDIIEKVSVLLKNI